MTSPTFDVRARLVTPPGPNDPAWLVVCRECGWHCETQDGYAWSGCPNCNASLWIVAAEGRGWPTASGSGFVTMRKAEELAEVFKPRRRRNHWRTGSPTDPAKKVLTAV